MSAVGRKRVLYYRVAYKQETAEPLAPVSQSEADTDLQQVNEYYLRASRGLFSIDWKITPLLVLPKEKMAYERSGGLAFVLNDARELARAAGYNYQDFDFDVVRISSLVGSEAGGQGKIGERGAWVALAGPYIVAHELGHNLGLNHANLWSTGMPNTFSPGTHPSGTPEAALHLYPRDADSLIGHESIYGPGEEREYGDPFDLMGGSSEGAINAIFQYEVGWLPEAGLTTATNDGPYRLYAFDSGAIGEGRTYLLRLGDTLWQGEAQRTYWIQYRHNPGLSVPAGGGVLLYWNDLERTHGPTLLLDAEPGDDRRQLDATLKTGKTYFDPLLGLYITPIRSGATDGAPWIDVEINRTPKVGNRAPTLQIQGPEGIAVGEAATFQANASDPDGDELSFFWDFGDGTNEAAVGSITKRYFIAGEYVVRVEVSDRKGGKTSGHLIIRVGVPATYRISGKVRDSSGNPVQDVRVHNGVYARNPGSANYRFTFTDSQGRYTLTGLTGGSYSNAAFHLGYECRLAGGEQAITITNSSAENVDFIAEPLPVVALQLKDRKVREDGSTLLAITRTHRIDQPLAVHLAVGGGAAGRNDILFEGPWIVPLDLNTVSTYEIRFPAGASVAEIEVAVPYDITVEPEETLRFALPWPARLLRTNANGVLRIPVPGWELESRYGTTTWVQSRPGYVLGQAFAGLVIQDSTNSKPVVRIIGSKNARENPPTPGEFWVMVSGERQDDLSVAYTITGSALNGVDYNRISGELVIPARGSVGVIPIAPMRDEIFDPNETVLLELIPDSSYYALNERAQIIIRDEPIFPEVLSIEIDPSGSVIVWANVQAARVRTLEATTNLLSPWAPLQGGVWDANRRVPYRVDRNNLQPMQIFRSLVELTPYP